MNYEQVYRDTAKASAGVIKITHSELEEVNPQKNYRFNKVFEWMKPQE